ncbi:hypothetical protein [Schlesneria sp. T3-172]|uniref:hypothetical protein n=1 Tax=Schlesneria sphaerica TaxID=3373610 RepID=UPI0037C79B29
MFALTESDRTNFSNVRLIEQAVTRMKQTVAQQFERESQMQRLFTTSHERWMSQYDQLRSRIETLEARLAPWMTERVEGPRLAVVDHEEVGEQREDAA